MDDHQPRTIKELFGCLHADNDAQERMSALFNHSFRVKSVTGSVAKNKPTQRSIA